MSGWEFSTLIALCIIFATAATLNANGVTDIQTSSQAAEACALSRRVTFALFSRPASSQRMLAVPVLAGSAAYGSAKYSVDEGLDRRPKEAKAFYATSRSRR